MKICIVITKKLTHCGILLQEEVTKPRVESSQERKTQTFSGITESGYQQ